MTNPNFKSKYRVKQAWQTTVMVAAVIIAVLYLGLGFTEEVFAQPKNKEAKKVASPTESAPANKNNTSPASKNSGDKSKTPVEKKSKDQSSRAAKSSNHSKTSESVKKSGGKIDMAAEKTMIEKAVANIKRKEEAKSKYYVPEPVQESKDSLNIPLGFTSLDKLGQKKVRNQEKFEKQIKGDADYVRSSPENRQSNIETSPTLSWPGLIDKKAGPASRPSPNPSAGFTVSAPLLEEKENSLYIYRHTPEKEDDAHWGMMWSHKF